MTQGGARSAFSDRVVRAPRPYDVARGEEVGALFSDRHGDVRSVLIGAAGSSPYLTGLIERDADWLKSVVEEPPEDSFQSLLDAIDTHELAALPKALRAAKKRVALLTALCDLAGVWSLSEVTGALTRFADLAVDRVIRALVAQSIARGRLPGMGEVDLETTGGFVAIAMGKMGAGELNYSSDIDLICLFDQGRFDPDNYLEARSEFVRITRTMAKILSDNTADGYVFRTDLRLRPDPAVTPVCLAMETAERYYESVGRTWERAAYIKARPAGGDLVAGQAYLERLAPFVFRRHLDYAAIQDAHDMRLRIREHKALGGALKLENHDMKLGSGGIREIEFYTQTRQIIAGGRDPELRGRETVAALRALEAKGWTDVAEDLIGDYRAHREVEHRLQMIADQQTHQLPGNTAGFDRLAALMGTETPTLRSDLLERLKRVAGITEGFFSPVAARDAPELSAASAEIVARWPSYSALRSDRAAEIFGRVQPELLSRLRERAARPDEALVHIDGFLAGLPAGVQLFSMFDANPQLIDLIVDIAATSPALAQHLSRHSAVLDAVIGGGFFEPWPGCGGLTHALAADLSGSSDYETQLMTARRWRNEWHFRVGVHHLRGLIDGNEAGRQYADIADAVLKALWTPVVSEFSRKHGSPPGRGASVLAMGSLGAQALTNTSDLDLIIVYDAGGAESSDGPRPLPPQTYYARLTQAFLTALTAPMGPGRLYEVDMRLRPSGRQGPVATALSSFTAYQRDEAWTWEHLALTRARPVAGNAELGDEIEAFRADLLSAPREAETVKGDVSSMRARLFAAKPGGGVWNVKDGAGRLQDIALLAQTAALLAGSAERSVADQLCAGASALGLDAQERDALNAAHALLWRVQAAERLMTGDAFSPEAAGEGGHAFLLRETGLEAMASIEAHVNAAVRKAQTIISASLPAPMEEGDG